MYEKDDKRLITHAKDACSTSEFINSGTGGNILASDSMFIIAGHSRHATVGDITPQNAHPFRAGDIFGMHNGTVVSKGSKGKTDSQEIFEDLNKLDRDAWPDYFRDLDKKGAFALVFIDIKTNSLYIVRNNERTLYYADHIGVKYFASEWAMLDFWKKRCNISQANISWFEPMRLYSWNLTDLSKTTEVDLKPEEKVVPPWQGNSVPLIMGPKDVKTHAKDEEHDYLAYRAKRMSTNKALGLLQHGCALCDKVSSLKEVTWWSNNEVHYCNKCYEKSEFVKNYHNVNPLTILYRSSLVKKGDANEGVQCN